jgi:uncharacterized protein YnzC (UPF0291/DUF896 family)
MEYLNRYNDTYTFTKTEDGDVLWEGSFEYCRLGWANNYDDAYIAYTADMDTDERLTFGEFTNAVHKEGLEKYRHLVKTDVSKIHMVDPSGGPYIEEGMHLGRFSDEFQNMIVHGFEPIETGFKIITKK